MKHQIAILIVFAVVLTAFVATTTILLNREEPAEIPVIEDSEESVEEVAESSEPEVVVVKETPRVKFDFDEIRRIREARMNRNFSFIYESLFNESDFVEKEEPKKTLSLEDEPVKYTLDYSNHEGFYYYTGYYKYGKSYDMPMNLHYQSMVFKYCMEYEVPYELALAVSGVETSFDAERGVVVGRNGHAYFGPGMVNKAYYEKRTGKTLRSPEDGVVAMIDTLDRKLNEFNNNFHHALMAYNYGSGYTRGKIADGQQSSKYSNRVMEIYNGLLQYKKENP